MLLYHIQFHCRFAIAESSSSFVISVCLSSPVLVRGQFQAKGQKVSMYYCGIALTSTLQLVAAVGVNHFIMVATPLLPPVVSLTLGRFYGTTVTLCLELPYLYVFS